MGKDLNLGQLLSVNQSVTLASARREDEGTMDLASHAMSARLSEKGLFRNRLEGTSVENAKRRQALNYGSLRERMRASVRKIRMIF